jgi:hypothetical protein
VTPSLTHLDDADVLRVLDGACESAEREEHGAHVASCPACGTRAGVLARRVERLGRTLAAADPASRPIAFPAARIARAAQRRTIRRWGIAAAITLLIAGAAGVPPVRAWIVGAARTLFSRTTRGPAAVRPAAAPAAPVAPLDTAGAVTFTPPDNVFVLRIAGRQAVGTVTIEAAERASASATVTGDRGSVELLVLPDGLRIVNAQGSRAGYVVRLPGALSRVVLQIGQEAPIVLVPVARAGRWVVDLSARN